VAERVTARSSVEPHPSLLDGFADDHLAGEVDVEERERQLTGTRPKTMAVTLGGFLPIRRENSALWRI
jgi:hypothetical protein